MKKFFSVIDTTVIQYYLIQYPKAIGFLSRVIFTKYRHRMRKHTVKAAVVPAICL